MVGIAHVRFARQPERFLEAASPELRIRLLAAIAPLETNPFPRGTKPLAGVTRAYRLRVGDYRILYERRDSIILIVRIDKRSRVYDG